MNAGAAADVENRCRRISKISLQDVLSAISLELSNTVLQPT
jgi:hypothetical protein